MPAIGSPTPTSATLQPVPISSGFVTIAEDGVEVVLTLALRLEAEAALDLCMRLIGAAGRVKKQGSSLESPNG
jgi:hypothetical protein